MASDSFISKNGETHAPRSYYYSFACVQCGMRICGSLFLRMDEGGGKDEDAAGGDVSEEAAVGAWEEGGGGGGGATLACLQVLCDAESIS